MQEQTLTQTITISYGNLSSTGSPFFFALLAAFILLTIGIALFLFRKHLHHIRFNTSSMRVLVLFLALGTLLAYNLSPALAAPTLTLASNQQNLTISIPEASTTTGTTTAEAITTLTTSTLNDTGYTLTVSLAEPEEGVGIELKGGEVDNFQALAPEAEPTTLTTTNSANTPSESDSTDITLKFTIDSSVTPGGKQLKLTYKVVDNQPTEPETPPAPLTMQTMTSDYCQNYMTIYDGTNEEAILTLSDPRGEGATYQIAKLADSNCWMLDNLRLGSMASTTLLTPEDTNIAGNFTLPVITDGSGSYNTIEEGKSTNPDDHDGGYTEDYPRTYGPILGDLEGGPETNYGYLYNWSAATAGETRTTHDETAGDAPYSICPANWRLPTGGADENLNPSPTSDFNILNARMAGFASTTDPAYLAVIDDPWQGSWPTLHFLQANWLHNGPFKGVFAGAWLSSISVGVEGDLWSASATPGWGGAFSASFSSDFVIPGNDENHYGRANGFGVRCLLD